MEPSFLFVPEKRIWHPNFLGVCHGEVLNLSCGKIKVNYGSLLSSIPALRAALASLKVAAGTECCKPDLLGTMW